ncbi:site-2 protease family protein [Rhodobaculum claviforme]|uniref:Zinc metalloprotease n=1 Tax=Rhodobaculum claviforme TaxID=1549854 RepID=A0A934TN66_9RHOB|nr:site-2 protease family protein [Rhodobaculum claviforme]MBK5928317.1 site-2 protease family protein [Rhodobaculum claviforme]
MTWSFAIGRLLGSELRVHATFFLLLLWVGTVAFVAAGPVAAVVNIAFILVLFACVVAHEYGHALMARRYGIATPDITLLPIGGMARLERMPEKPRQEIAVALAGPAVNIVIFVVLVGVFRVDLTADALMQIEDPAEGFLARVAMVNLFLVLFNMLPAFPMDGGRVFRAVLSIWLPRVRATRIAAHAGQAMAFLFGFLGLYTANPLLVLIAVFIFIAAGAESSFVAMQDFGRQTGVRAAMITNFETLAEDASLNEAAAALIRTTQHEFPVVDPTGRMVGLLTRRALYAALTEEEGRRARPIAPHITRDVPTVPLGAPLEAAMEAMASARSPAVGVTGPSGGLIGYVTHENIGELMVVSGRG